MRFDQKRFAKAHFGPMRIVAGITLLAIALAGCYDGDPSDFREAVIANREGVTALAVDGELPVIETGSSLQLTATATTTSGTTNLSALTTWRSSNPAVIVVSAGGYITAVANGSAQITAELAQFSDTVTVAASSAALQSVTVAGSATVDECTTAPYTASGHYDDGTDRDITSLVNWTVSNASVARMSTLTSDRNTLVSFLAGTTGISATRNSVASPLLMVTVADTLDAITVTPAAPPQIPLNGSQQFTATGTWDAVTANISRAALWQVVNTDISADLIASVVNGDVGAGLVAGDNAGGTGTLTVSCGGLASNIPLTVVHLDTLAISNTRPIELKANASVLLVLEGTYSDSTTKPLNESAVWSVTTVSGTAVTVSNTAGTRGRVTAGTGEGVATITATVGGKSVAVSVSVVP